MKEYKTHSVVTASKQVILSDMPFGVGEEVEVVVSNADRSRAERVRKLTKLFKTTQSLPQAQKLTDADVLNEVAAHRNGK